MPVLGSCVSWRCVCGWGPLGHCPVGRNKEELLKGGIREKCACVMLVRTSGCDISSRLPVTSLGQQCEEGSPPPVGVCDVIGSVGGVTVCVAECGHVPCVVKGEKGRGIEL